MSPQQREDRYQPLALIGVTLIALLGFAVFFLSFLVAPLAILLIFYVGFAASDRSRRRRSNGNGNGNGNGANGTNGAAATNGRAVVEANGAHPVAAAPVHPRSGSARLAREAQLRRNAIERAEVQEPPTPR